MIFHTVDLNEATLHVGKIKSTNYKCFKKIKCTSDVCLEMVLNINVSFVTKPTKTEKL